MPVVTVRFNTTILEREKLFEKFVELGELSTTPNQQEKLDDQ